MMVGVSTVKSARAPWMASAEKRATETRVEYIVRATCKEWSRELRRIKRRGTRVRAGGDEDGGRETRCEEKGRDGGTDFACAR